MRRSPTTPAHHGGFTLVESMIALSVIAFGFAALYSMSSSCFKLMAASREEITAGQALQDRGDSLRNCTWVQVTDPAYLAGSVMNTAANNAPLMKNVTETVTVNAYPTALNPPIKLTRSSTGTVTTVSSNAAIANGNMVKIDVQYGWVSRSGNRPHTTALSTIFAQNTK